MLAKRFILFIGKEYYPNPGMGDLYGEYDTYEEAKAIVDKLANRELPGEKYPQNNYALIVDRENDTEEEFEFEVQRQKDKPYEQNWHDETVPCIISSETRQI